MRGGRESRSGGARLDGEEGLGAALGRVMHTNPHAIFVNGLAQSGVG